MAECSRQPPAATLEELQEQLASFAIIYNTTRPHAAQHGATPTEAYAATPKHHHDADGPSTAPTRASQRRANIHGQFKVNSCAVHLGATYRDQTITVFVTGDHVVVYHDGKLLGEVDLHPKSVSDVMRQPVSHVPRHHTSSYSVTGVDPEQNVLSPM